MVLCHVSLVYLRRRPLLAGCKINASIYVAAIVRTDPQAARIVRRRTLESLMFRHILVPSDLTDRTIRALEIAVRLARQDHARITLLHVIETITGTHFDELLSFYGELERRAAERLKAIAGSAAAGQPPPAIEIVYGKRVEEVLRFVRDKQVDLIVLASHPVDPAQPSGGLGTMSYKLGALGPCAVLLVK